MRRLLTFEDLTNFYTNKYKKTVHFDASKTGEPIVVQTKGIITFEKTEVSEITEGLTPVRLQSCHTDRNLNSSSISYDVMKNRFLPTFKNRPILGFIHDVDGEPCFYGHNMHIEETEDGEELVYDEIPVGIIPETNNAELVYDEEAKHYNVMVDGYIFNEYTKAASILEKEQELAVSVELSLNAFSYNPKEKLLVIEDGYFSGVTILQCDDNGNEVRPGMANSNIKLKDFSESNNSLFSSITEEENNKLIDTLERLNTTLENFNINNDSNESVENYGKEDENLKKENMEQEVTEEVTETEQMAEENTEVVETEAEASNESAEDTVEETPEVIETESEEEAGEEDAETPEVTEEEACKPKKKCEEDSEETESEEDFKCKKKNEMAEFTKNFTLSMEDTRYALYNLLLEVESADNDCYGICQTFDNYMIYVSYYTGKAYKQGYSVNGDNIAFEGSRVEVFAEYLTKEEVDQLNDMRSNYSLISDKLSKYEAAELKAEKEAVFADEAYADFIETEGFKTIRENMDTYSVDELKNACELQFAKEVRAKKSFSLEKPEESKKSKYVSFASVLNKNEDGGNAFLNGLRDLGRNK